MNLTNILKTFCVLSLGLGFVPAAKAQEGPPPPFKPMAEHKVLAEEVGTWDASVKTFMAGPTAPPTVSKGTETNRLMTGGLWLLSDFSGDIGGAKFEGHGQFGFDPTKKKYVGTWVDSMSPNISQLEGTYDAKTRTITYVGDGFDSTSNMKYSQKMVTTMKEDGTRVFTLYMKFEKQPEETKFLEITYTKRK